MKAPQEYMTNHPALGLGAGNNGFFRFIRENIVFNVIASDGEGWEHVSVTINKNRCPTWEEMCMVKDLFWDDDDCVVQYHPPSSKYVNNHKYCLHLWRSLDKEMPVPHPTLVGLK